MITISGIKYQKELEKLPYFNKKTVGILIGKKEGNLDKKIEQLIRKKYLISLKKGLYVASAYLSSQSKKSDYCEYIANILRYPSYLSLEYVLSINNLIPEAIYAWTSITLKTPRVYKNQLGSFIYRNVKSTLFTGFTKEKKGEFNISIATTAKSLFDYLYLKRNLADNLQYELNQGLRINWDNFSEEDLKEFEKYTIASQSKKMKKILKVIEEIKNDY